jgi:hypothetical protein
MRYWLILIMLCSVASTIQGELKPRPLAEWAILVYLDADCDLEEPMLQNIEEIVEAGGSTEKVRIAILADRAEAGEENESGSYTNRPLGNLKNWTTAKLLEPVGTDFVELEDWGEVNMGDPATLKRFITTSAKLFPAEKYMIIFSNHGSGWQGVCFDDSTDGDGLTLNEIASTLKETESIINKFEIIGFDACLMAGYELFESLAPFSKAQVASQELVPGTGWNYVTTIRQLNRNPKQNGIALGTAISDSFQDFFGKADRVSGREVTLSVIRSNEMRRVTAAMDTLTKELRSLLKHRGGWRKIAAARARTEIFGARSGNMFDLQHFSMQLQQEAKDAPSIVDACKRLQVAIQAAVAHNIHGKERPNAFGMHLFFPTKPEDLNDADTPDPERYSSLAVWERHSWVKFLTEFTEQTDRQPVRPILGAVVANPKKFNAVQPSMISGSVDEDQLDEVFFLATDVKLTADGNRKVYSAITTQPNDGRLKSEWNGTRLAMQTNKQTIPLPLVRIEISEADDAKDDDPGFVTFVAVVQIQVGGKGRWRNAYVEFIPPEREDAKKIGELGVVWLLDDKDRQIEHELSSGDLIRSVEVQLSKKNELLILEDPKSKPVRIGKKATASLVPMKLEPSHYQAGFLSIDLAGHGESRLIEVELSEE